MASLWTWRNSYETMWNWRDSTKHETVTVELAGGVPADGRSPTY